MRRMLVGALVALLLCAVWATRDARTVQAAGSPTNVSVSLSSPAASGSLVRYTVLLTTSASGALAANSGTITLAGPAGTLFTGSDGFDCNRTYVETLTDPILGSNCETIAITGGGTTIIFTLPINVAADQQVRLRVNGVTNSSAGAKNLAVSTSSDTISVNAPYTLVAAQQPTSTTLAIASTATGATQNRYTVDFTPSASGGLASNWSTITLSAPTGTVFSGAAASGIQDYDCNRYFVVNVTTQQSQNCIAFTRSADNTTVTLIVPQAFDILPGQSAQVIANGITNAGSTGGSLSVHTSSDTVARVFAMNLVVPQQLASASFVTTTTANGATQARYTVDFSPSSSGGLARNWSTITLSAPTGTIFSGAAANGIQDYDCNRYFVVNVTTEQSQNCIAFTRTNNNATVTLIIPAAFDITAGQAGQVIANGITNSGTAGGNLTVSTSADSVPAVLPLNLVAPHQLASVTAGLSATDTNAIDGRLIVDFTTSTSGGLAHDWSTITVQGPIGTVFPGSAATGIEEFSCDLYILANVTTSQYSNCFAFVRSNNNTTVSVRLNGIFDIVSSQKGRLLAYGVTNGSSEGGDFVISTTSDWLTRSVPAGLSAPNQLETVYATLSSNTPNAAGVTYTVLFHTSASGGLPQSRGTITLAAPVGTVFPPMNCGDYSIRNASMANQANCLQEVSSANGRATITIRLPNNSQHTPKGVPASFNIDSDQWGLLTITNVTNPPVTGAIQVSTSADPIPRSGQDAVTGSVSGKVTYNGTDVGGAGVEACTALQACTSTITAGDGTFSIPGGPGPVFLRAWPPATIPLARPTTKGPVAVASGQALTAFNIALDVSKPLPAGTSVSGPAIVSVADGVPSIFWALPFTYTVTACPWGIGSLAIGSPSIYSGEYEVRTFPLLEVPWGSGNYQAEVPPLEPLHGTADFGHAILCVGPTAIVPKSGTVLGGTTVVIHGNGFLGASAVRFGSQEARKFSVVDDNTIIALSPEGTGTVAVQVERAGGPTANDPLAQFSYLSVTGVSPAIGPAAGLTEVQISGSGFTNVLGVIFGDEPAAFEVLSDTLIRAWSPPGTGTVHVTVVNLGSSAETGADLFAYQVGPPFAPLGEAVSAPQVSSAASAANDDPPFVPSGNGYKDQPNIMNRIADFLAGYEIPDPDKPKPNPAPTTPANTTTGTSTGKIDPNGWVRDQFGVPIAGATATVWWSQTASGALSQAAANPAIMDPAINPETTDANGFFHWDVIAGWWQVRATAAGCHEPGDAGDLVGQTEVLPVPPPQIGLFIEMECPDHVSPGAPPAPSISPSIGAPSGGAEVIIHGSGFTGATDVKFGANSAQFKVLGPGTILATAPAGNVGAVDVIVLTPNGASAVGPEAVFSYLPLPAISGISTASASAGDVVTITGSGLAGITSLRFGTHTATTVIRVNDTSLQVVVPPGAGQQHIVATTKCPDGAAPVGATSCGESEENASNLISHNDIAGCNSEFDALDGLAALRVAAGFTDGLQPDAPCTADLDGDGVVSIRDVLLARRYAAGLES